MGKKAPTAAQRKLIWSRIHLECFRDQLCYVPYEPVEAAHFHPASSVLVSGANRVGKSVSAAMEAVAWEPFSDLIWLMADTYSRSRKEFDYTAEALIHTGLVSAADVSTPQNIHMPCSMRTASGCRIQTKTLKDMVKAMAVESPDLVVLCEPGFLREDPIDRLKLRLSTTRGRLWIAGTMEAEEGGPWLRETFERWQTWPNPELGLSVNVPLWYNVHDFPGGPNNPEIKYMEETMQANLYTEKVEGRPATSEFLVFGKLFPRGKMPINARHCPFVSAYPDGTRWPVEIAIDPGFYPSHYTVSFLQRHDDEIWVVDEVAVQGQSHEAVIRQAKDRPAWPNVMGGTIDAFAARSHGLGYQASPLDIWVRESELALRASVRPTPQEVIERWNYYLVHPMTGECRIFFDPVRCPRLLYETQRWRYHKDELGRPIRTDPQKRNCDALKGIGYFLVDDFSRKSWQRTFPPAAPRVSDWRLM